MNQLNYSEMNSSCRILKGTVIESSFKTCNSVKCFVNKKQSHEFFVSLKLSTKLGVAYSIYINEVR